MTKKPNTGERFTSTMASIFWNEACVMAWLKLIVCVVCVPAQTLPAYMHTNAQYGRMRRQNLNWRLLWWCRNLPYRVLTERKQKIICFLFQTLLLPRRAVVKWQRGDMYASLLKETHKNYLDSSITKRCIWPFPPWKRIRRRKFTYFSSFQHTQERAGFFYAAQG